MSSWIALFFLLIAITTAFDIDQNNVPDDSRKFNFEKAKPYAVGEALVLFWFYKINDDKTTSATKIEVHFHVFPRRIKFIQFYPWRVNTHGNRLADKLDVPASVKISTTQLLERRVLKMANNKVFWPAKQKAQAAAEATRTKNIQKKNNRKTGRRKDRQAFELQREQAHNLLKRGPDELFAAIERVLTKPQKSQLFKNLAAQPSTVRVSKSKTKKQDYQIFGGDMVAFALVRLNLYKTVHDDMTVPSITDASNSNSNSNSDASHDHATAHYMFDNYYGLHKYVPRWDGYIRPDLATAGVIIGILSFFFIGISCVCGLLSGLAIARAVHKDDDYLV